MSRALVVDDNRSLAEDLAEILQEEGYDVVVFHDALLAAARSPEIDFDFALLDVRMPGLDGVALHRQLLSHHPHARYVLMTAYADEERLAAARAAGVRRVLHKPLVVAELLRTVAELDEPGTRNG